MFDTKLLLDKSSPLWLVFLVRNPQPIRTCGVKERGGGDEESEVEFGVEISATVTLSSGDSGDQALRQFSAPLPLIALAQGHVPPSISAVFLPKH